MRPRSMLIFHILLSLNLLATEVSSQTRANVAVNDLSGQGVEQASAAIISDRLRTELFNTGTFKVLERQSMQDILKEQGFQQAGCTSDQCMVEMGQLLGVAQMVSGTVGKLGGMFTLNVRLIDVRTGEIVYTTSVDCRCAIEDVLTNSVPSIAGKIAASVSKSAASTAKAPATTQRPATGSLRIRTDPPGARIYVDKADTGLTPFTKDSVEVGSHGIGIQLEGYKRIETDIPVFAGHTADRKFKLSHTSKWRDSVEAAQRLTQAMANIGKPQKKHRFAPKIAFGVVSVGTAIAGAVFNSVEQGKIRHDFALKQQYISSGYSNTNSFQSQLDSNAKAARNLNTMRNICYISTGVCVAGFALSFAF